MLKKFVKSTLAALVAVVILIAFAPRVYADESPFGDIKSDFWAYDAIKEAYNDGVMIGTGMDASEKRVFSASEKLNMAQFVTVLTRAFYNDDVLNSKRGGTWPNQNYDAASKHNLFTGLVRYAGELEVTREMMAQVMYNVMVDKGAILPNGSEIQATMNKIPDLSSVDNTYRTAVAVSYYLDLLAGVDARGTFAPKGVLNRAQTAVIYTRLKRAINVLSMGNSGPGAPDPGTTINPGTTQPTSGATLTNGMPVTEENVLALIEEYRNGKVPGQMAKDAGLTSYVHLATYDAYTPAYRIVLPSGPVNGTECAKFAYAFFDDIFGSDAPIREVRDLADVRPGDLLQTPSHWEIATSKVYFDTEDHLYRASNVGGGPTGEIGWSTNSNISSVIAIYTRYPRQFE